MAILQALALALLMKEDPEAQYGPPRLSVVPSAFVLTGVGVVDRERPRPAGALELTLGPKFVINFNRKDALTLRLAPGWGMDYNAARALEHFGLLELGVGAELMRLFSVEYLIGGQVGVFEGQVDPGFRHAVAWRLFYFVGPEIQHVVASPSPTTAGRPRQVVRIMLGLDVAALVYWLS